MGHFSTPLCILHAVLVPISHLYLGPSSPQRECYSSYTKISKHEGKMDRHKTKTHSLAFHTAYSISTLKPQKR